MTWADWLLLAGFVAIFGGAAVVRWSRKCDCAACVRERYKA